jgi:hypothetical protein
MSDFFNISPKVLTYVEKAQEFLLREVKVITYVLRTDKFPKYKEGYTDFDALAPELIKSADSTLTKGLLELMQKFNKLGILATNSLIKNFKREEKKHKARIIAIQSSVETPKSPIKEEPKKRDKIIATQSSVEIPKSPTEVAPKSPAVEAPKQVATKDIKADYITLDAELEVLLDKIIAGGASGKLSTTSFVFNVVQTIRKYKRMSPKQKTFVDDALKKLEKLDS